MIQLRAQPRIRTGFPFKHGDKSPSTVIRCKYTKKALKRKFQG